MAFCRGWSRMAPALTRQRQTSGAAAPSPAAAAAPRSTTSARTNPHSRAKTHRAFVQSGFNEVLASAHVATLAPPRTSQKPPDSRSGRVLIHRLDWTRGPARMGRAYSMDLRERVVAAVAQEGLSRRQAAARFGISDSTAINWLKRVATKGSVAPGQIGGHKPKKIAGAHRDCGAGLHLAWARGRTRRARPLGRKPMVSRKAPERSDRDSSAAAH